ncbi:hypothetical protein JTB14_000903 [Gonioctena quinquepunctata]|nr:hypothetical protein JTB14_000903 [Gonioctena quinquepunctata]
MAFATQHQSLETGSDQLTEDLEAMHKYSTKWCLKPNPVKSEVSAFHLPNKLAHNELNAIFGGERVKQNHNPTYLGVTLDRSSTYCQHLTTTALKIKAKNNILRKIAGLQGEQTRTLLEMLLQH